MKISYKTSHTCAIWVSNIVNKNKLHDTSAIYCIWYRKAIPEERLPSNSSFRLVLKENILIAISLKRGDENVDIKFSAHERFWNNLHQVAQNHQKVIPEEKLPNNS
jgi:hypothetical protein